jgi:hypothetical protein
VSHAAVIGAMGVTFVRWSALAGNPANVFQSRPAPPPALFGMGGARAPTDRVYSTPKNAAIPNKLPRAYTAYAGTGEADRAAETFVGLSAEETSQ